MLPARLSIFFTALFVFATFAATSSAQLLNTSVETKTGVRVPVQPETGKVSSKGDTHDFTIADSVGKPSTDSPQAESSVSNGVSNAGLAVTNAWPNPMHPSNELHLEVMSDIAGAGTAKLYDLDGSVKATLNLGELTSGPNELQVSLPEDLLSGEYILRITEGNSASEIVRINYVK